MNGEVLDVRRTDAKGDQHENDDDGRREQETDHRQPTLVSGHGAPSSRPRSVNPAADALECKRRDVVPVEPDEEGPAPQVVVRDESPVAAVVAVVPVVAHHEVMTGRNPAFEAAL